MQNVNPRLERSPGRLAHAGPSLGAHNREVLVGELGLDDVELARLEELGVVRTEALTPAPIEPEAERA